MNDKTILSLHNVNAGYGMSTILFDVSLEIKKGEILTLAGCNGSGKSTLLKVSSRQIPLKSGKILLNGKMLSAYSQKELAKTISFLTQMPSTPAISVESLTLHGRFPYLGFSRKITKEDKEKVEQAMEMAGVASFRRRDLRQLSGGERQKAFLSMVIAQDTDVLFLDEPTTYLDIGKQFEILELVKKINRGGKTIVMVLHDLSHVLSYSDRVALVEKGEILALDDPKKIYENGLLDAVFGVQGHFAEREKVYYFTPFCKK